MKRLNPTTGLLFKQGAIREDGYIFMRYVTTKLKKNGFFEENWLSPTSFEKAKASTAKWCQENPEKKKAGRAKWYQENSEKAKALTAKWRKENPEAAKALNAKWRKENPEAAKALNAKWRKENSEAVKANNAKWRKENPERVNANVAKRRAAKLQRTPPWANLKTISVWYFRAQLASKFMDEIYHVDHIVPLRGKLVSGLHVEYNLQLLTALENSSKNNNFILP